jgi:hypothetical protein
MRLTALIFTPVSSSISAPLFCIFFQPNHLFFDGIQLVICQLPENYFYLSKVTAFVWKACMQKKDAVLRIPRMIGSVGRDLRNRCPVAMDVCTGIPVPPHNNRPLRQCVPEDI